MPFLKATAQREAARILLAVMLCLLAEQWAFATHVGAPAGSMPGCSMRMMMPMPRRGRMARTVAEIACVAHCTAQPAALPPLPKSTAPPRFDIALPVVPAILSMGRPVRLIADHTVLPRPPPRFRTLLYCSLLI